MDLERERVRVRSGRPEAMPLGAPEELYIRARRALRRDDRRAAESSIALLSRSLETHFALEDRVYFPAVAALRPALGPSLQRLRLQHEQMLAFLAELLARVFTDGLESLAESLAELISTFERHEGDEEAILATLDAEPDGLSDGKAP